MQGKEDKDGSIGSSVFTLWVRRAQAQGPQPNGGPRIMEIITLNYML